MNVNYRSPVTVCAEEFKQGMQAFFVNKQLWREMAVQELHAVANGFWEWRTRESGIEWFEVQLKHKIIHRAASSKKNKRNSVATYELNWQGNSKMIAKFWNKHVRILMLDVT